MHLKHPANFQQILNKFWNNFEKFQEYYGGENSRFVDNCINEILKFSRGLDRSFAFDCSWKREIIMEIILKYSQKITYYYFR